MQIEFRPAVDSDLEALRRLDAECFPQGSLDLEPAASGELEAGIREGSALVALSDSEVVGMMQLKKSDSEWELLSLAITQTQRGKGLGKSFMTELLGQWRLSQIPISCVTSPNNQAMRGLLESSGFEEQDSLNDHFGEGKHRLLYRLDIR